MKPERWQQLDQVFHSALEGAPLSALNPLAHLGLARAAALMGDTDKSRKAYEQFFVVEGCGHGYSYSPTGQTRVSKAEIKEDLKVCHAVPW